jgi:predicted DNA-binding protein (UPF0251 family)
MIFCRDGVGGREMLTREEAARLLVMAVLATAAEDIVAGREDVAWLGSATCRHWCEWVELEPDAVRRAVERQLPARRPDRRRRVVDLSREELEKAVMTHARGTTWVDAAAMVGVSIATLRMALQRAGVPMNYRTNRADRNGPVVMDVKG